MNIERFIAVYDRYDDSLVDDIKIDLATELLLDIFQIDKEDDPDAHKPYQVSETQFGKLKKLLPVLEEFDFNNVRMHLECFSIE